MKDIKLTLKACTKHYRTWGKALWKPYVSLAVSFAVLLIGFYLIATETLLPLWVYGHETDNWDLILSLIGIDLLGLILFIIGLVATVVAAVWSHHTMRNLVGYSKKNKKGERAWVNGYEKRDITGRRRNALIMEVILLMLAAIIVGFLPVIVIFISGLAATRSGMMLDEVVTPSWVWWSLILCSIIGMLLCEIAMTFSRLCFRDIPEPKEVVAENEEEAASENGQETSPKDNEK